MNVFVDSFMIFLLGVERWVKVIKLEIYLFRDTHRLRFTNRTFVFVVILLFLEFVVQIISLCVF